MFMLLNMAILMKTLFIIFEPHFDVLIICYIRTRHDKKNDLYMCNTFITN